MGKQEIKTLRNAFDDVFCLNDKLILPLNMSEKYVAFDDVWADELRGKIFAFSLEGYDKCFFLSADTILLENCDKLFQKTAFTTAVFNKQSDRMFLFSPNWEVCLFLIGKYEQSMPHEKNGVLNNFILKSVDAWMRNNKSGNLLKDKMDLSTVTFSMKTGRAVGVGSCIGLPTVVQFFDEDLCDIEFVVRLKKFHFKSKTLGFLEQVI